MMTDEAIDHYRDLIEQGLPRSSAAAHIQIVYGEKLSDTWCELIERHTTPLETW